MFVRVTSGYFLQDLLQLDCPSNRNLVFLLRKWYRVASSKGLTKKKKIAEYNTLRYLRKRHCSAMGSYWLDDGTDCLFQIEQIQFIQIFSFHVHKTVHISVDGDRCVCMSRNFTQRFDIYSRLNTAGSKGVSKRMKMDIFQVAIIHILLKSELQHSWLHVVRCSR